MAEKTGTGKALKKVETLTHEEASRLNIPTAELQSLVQKEHQDPLRVAYERRNRDLDPQLVWRGKDQQDWSDLVVNAPPIYIQEKVHPKVLIDDLVRRTKANTAPETAADQFDLFADFNGLPNAEAKTEFYQHDSHWSNRMILGDSLQVMASLAEREGLRGKVQCIYFDPPYGIKFNSNFQWSTTSRKVGDSTAEITREAEQVKAFRDTWRDGIHSYLTYLRDRLTVARDLLTDSGSLFLQIGDENVHLIRSLLSEVFGEENFIQTIVIKKKSSTTVTEPVNDFVLWTAKCRKTMKVRELTVVKDPAAEKSRFTKLEFPDTSRIDVLNATAEQIADPSNKLLNDDYPMVSQDPQEGRSGPYRFRNASKLPGPNRHWTLDPICGMRRLERANRLRGTTNTVRGVVYLNDYGRESLNNIWEYHGERNPIYVVQTNRFIVQRCILMTTDPGNLVLDPTCGSGTTAHAAEQWGRRWITIDTSRVAFALARARLMSASFAYYVLSEAYDDLINTARVASRNSVARFKPRISQGFAYHRVPKISLSAIADNTEIDVIWDKFQQTLEPLREALNQTLKQTWEEWQIPRNAEEPWPAKAKYLHKQWWESRTARQNEIDASIGAKAEPEYLYDKPYEDKSKVRVAGPFTVESLSPHRALGVDENDELIDPHAKNRTRDFAQIILDNLRTAGVQQAHKEDKIAFSSLTAWPGEHVCAEGRYTEAATNAAKRAAIFIGPEFGTVQRTDLITAAREAAEAGFDVLIACAFNFDAHSSELQKLGRVPILKTRMNADLHMAEDLKNTGKGNLFVVFGEPDIDLLTTPDGKYQVRINGVDVFHPATGEVRSDGPEGIACWFLDTDYNEESFFVRHAYFLGQNDPYKALRTTLKAEIDEDAWATLHRDTSRPFEKPASGRIAVKVINHLGDEVMKVFRVS